MRHCGVLGRSFPRQRRRNPFRPACGIRRLRTADALPRLNTCIASRPDEFVNDRRGDYGFEVREVQHLVGHQLDRRAPTPLASIAMSSTSGELETRLTKFCTAEHYSHARRKGKGVMNSDQVIERFRRTGALLEGHFVLTSGLHSTHYLQCALVLQQPAEAEALARAIAENFRGQPVETVAAPAIGGIVIGYEVARALGVRSIWTEREGGRMTLRAASRCTPEKASSSSKTL